MDPGVMMRTAAGHQLHKTNDSERKTSNSKADNDVDEWTYTSKTSDLTMISSDSILAYVLS
jgi:hypothetical protein